MAWNVASRDPLAQWHAGAEVDSIAIHPAGRLLAVSGVSIRDTTRLWDVEAQRWADTEKPGQASETHAECRYSRDGLTLASVGAHPALMVHDALTLRVIRSLHADDNETPQCTAVSSDGSLVALGFAEGNRGMVKVWRTKDAELLHDFYADFPPIYSLVFTADSQSLVTGGPRGELRVWDMKTGKMAAPWIGHANTSHVVDLEFSLNGRLASSGTDGSVCIWDMDSVQPRQRKFSPNGQPVRDISWSPCGRHLATANSDGMVYVFRLSVWESEAR